ncbi:hypothetical protein GCM10008101_27760 [Lysobacter xinjiangensis]|uniref:DNA helicase n=1 Tax=Cognatilysobacter xinjiangensis TaxID=546892 RepID=A0ABQ3C9I5_9GAMM|nr:hypothetical protein GCM10008101_27760 [Lysobacter xinjiangensis]
MVFPDVNAADNLGIAATREITLFAEDLDRLEQSLIQVFSHWGPPKPFSSSDLSRLITLLAPTVTVERTLDVAIRRSEAEIIRLTEDQQRVFDRLRGIPRLIISGGPGTGKTLLAVQRARHLATQGGKVRFVCYNELLSRRLKKQLQGDTNIEVATFHSLCIRTLKAAGVDVPRNPTSSWWESDGPQAMRLATQQSAERVDALIVDEGQDFSPVWFSALMAGLADRQHGLMYVFADDRQELWSRSWRDGLPHFGEFSLWENCRNTAEIATCVNAVYKDAPAETGAQGAPVVVVRYGVDDDLVSTVLALGARLVEDHNLRPSELTVLTDDVALAARLTSAYILDTPIVSFGGNGITCETVSRFKGLESAAVLLALGRGTATASQRLASAYIGLSRARAAAIVVIPEEHPAALSIYSAAQRR